MYYLIFNPLNNPKSIIIPIVQMKKWKLRAICFNVTQLNKMQSQDLNRNQSGSKLEPVFLTMLSHINFCLTKDEDILFWFSAAHISRCKTLNSSCTVLENKIVD